jgi:hypothetical protein
MKLMPLRGRGHGRLPRRKRFLLKVSRTASKALERTKVLEHRVRVLEEKLRFLESLSHLRRVERSGLVAQLGDLLRPVPSGHLFERIGSSGDGGYVVPSDVPLPRTVISVGVGHECSADDALAERGVNVWQFDHTVTSSPSEHLNVRFIRRGLGGSDAGGDLASLAELLGLVEEPLGDMWLMLDAEGVEWDTLADDSAPLGDFQVIVIEFHMLGAAAVPELLNVMLRGARRLAMSHVPIAWSANNFAPIYAFSGLVVPDVLEVTFVAKTLFKPGTGTVPLRLYRLNNEHGPVPPTPFTSVEWNPYGATPGVFTDAMISKTRIAELG